MHRDVMQNAGLEFFAEIGLIIFVLAFTVMLVRLFFFKKDTIQHISALPLQHDEGTPEGSHNHA